MKNSYNFEKNRSNYELQYNIKIMKNKYAILRYKLTIKKNVIKSVKNKDKYIFNLKIVKSLRHKKLSKNMRHKIAIMKKTDIIKRGAMSNEFSYTKLKNEMV